MTAFSGEIVVRRTRGFRPVDLLEIWAHRDLIRIFVWRDFVARYKQTILGPLWYVLQPLITTLIFLVVFSRVAAVPTDGLPPTLFYLCGLLPWSYFAQTFGSTSTTLVGNAALFGKVYFPRLVVPISAAISNLAALAIQFVSFAVVYALHRVSHPDANYGARWEALLLPVLVLHLAALSLGVGLWLSALTVRFRDLTVLSAFVIQLWMYVTPVIYPLAQVPQPWRLIAALNPMTAPVEAFRYVLLGRGSVTVGLLLTSTATAVLALVSGALVFQRAERTSVDLV